MHPFRIAASAPSATSAAHTANGAPSAPAANGAPSAAHAANGAPSATHAAGFLKKPVALVMLSRPCSQLEMVSGGGSPVLLYYLLSNIGPPCFTILSNELIGPSAAKFYNFVFPSFVYVNNYHNLFFEASTSAASASPAKEPKWGKRKLSYTFDSSFPEDDEAKQAVVRASQEWERVSEFSFIPCDDSLPDIVIGMHSTAYATGVCPPFESKLVLGHASLPPDGKVHFNSDQNWSYSLDGPPHGSRSFDLQSVALHEIGHILGLKHSKNKNAVMYKSIKGGKMKRQLTKVDIGMLKSLYL